MASAGGAGAGASALPPGAPSAVGIGSVWSVSVAIGLGRGFHTVDHSVHSLRSAHA